MNSPGPSRRGYLVRLTTVIALLLLGLVAISWEWRHAHHLLHGHGGAAHDSQHVSPLQRHGG